MKITVQQKIRISGLTESFGINETLSGVDIDNDGTEYFYFKSAYGNGYACVQKNGAVEAGNLGYFSTVKLNNACL